MVKTVMVVAAVVLVGWATYLIDTTSSLRLVGIIVGVSAATALLLQAFNSP